MISPSSPDGKNFASGEFIECGEIGGMVVFAVVFGVAALIKYCRSKIRSNMSNNKKTGGPVYSYYLIIENKSLFTIKRNAIIYLVIYQLRTFHA